MWMKPDRKCTQIQALLSAYVVICDGVPLHWKFPVFLAFPRTETIEITANGICFLVTVLAIKSDLRWITY